MPSSIFSDVLVVGAGPVGLLLACELRLAGCAVQVLEQASDPHTPLKRAPFGLRGLSVPTIESFDRRNLLHALEARAAASGTLGGTHGTIQQRRAGGHFAGIQFVQERVDSARWPYRFPGPHSIAADMESVEAVLASRAEALGVSVRRGFRVSSVETTDEQAMVRADGDTFRGAWLVGCDGGRSMVRKASGFGFPGTEPELTGYFVRAELANPEVLTPGHHNTPTGTYIYEPPAVIRMAEFDGGASHRAEPITRDHVRAVLRRISGTEVELTKLELATTWTDRACIATEYRRGRVLLAGDAAHVHAPLGGQGLNLGLGDAMNLGWKLAATVRGHAAAGLLDSYERERRPVAEQVLDWSRAQVALMRPSRSSHALAAIVRDLMATRDGATYFAERVWSTGTRYDLDDSHPLVGRSAPNFELVDGTRSNEHLRAGKVLLLDLGGSEPLRRLAECWREQVCYLRCDARERLGLHAILVRPDGFIAWASDHPSDGSDAARALSRWFRLTKPSPMGP